MNKHRWYILIILLTGLISLACLAYLLGGLDVLFPLWPAVGQW